MTESPARSSRHLSTAVGGQRAVIATARAMRASGRAFALAIVVQTEGSTYRKPGALAIVGADGTHVGVISGGCLEPGLEVLAREAMHAGAPRATVFDTRSDDDLLFGSGSGCRGRMHVLALPSGADGRRVQVDAIIEAGTERRPLTLSLPGLAPGLFDAGEVTIRPLPQLLLIGAGPEAGPLLRIGRTLGWYCCVADHREALLTAERAREADRTVSLRPAPAIRRLADEHFDAALVMTHVASTDLEALRSLAPVDVPYVGLLGPPARRDELIAQLTPEERHALEGRLHAPVGLPLGGEGPEAIALAIAAELQSVFNAK
jgi:xanthine dehydrogenase accessory factor